MKLFHDLTLYLHIAAGTVAFIAAPIALAIRKGGKGHRNWGKIYFWAMTMISISGIVLSVLLQNLFLFCVAFFSYHLVASGYRWLYRKNPNQKVALLDYAIHIIAGVFNAGLVVVGVMRWFQDSSDAFAYISTVFGLLGLNFSRTNIIQLLHPPERKANWLFNHIAGMIGGYIATVSAFSAVNMHFLPTIIQWLWPTIIGIPVMYAFFEFYKRKLRAGRKVEEMVEVKST